MDNSSGEGPQRSILKALSALEDAHRGHWVTLPDLIAALGMTRPDAADECWCSLEALESAGLVELAPCVWFGLSSTDKARLTALGRATAVWASAEAKKIEHA